MKNEAQPCSVIKGTDGKGNWDIEYRPLTIEEALFNIKIRLDILEEKFTAKADRI